MKALFPIVTCEHDNASAFEHTLLTLFGFFPYKVLVFSAVVTLLDSSVYLIVSTFVLSTLLYGYVELVGRAALVARPAEYDIETCGGSPNALPDTLFVSTMIYVFSVAFGIGTHRVFAGRVSAWRAVTLASLPVGYCVTTLVTHYFNWWQLAANLAISAALAVGYWFVYWRLQHLLWRDASEVVRRHMSRVAGLLGVRTGDWHRKTKRRADVH